MKGHEGLARFVLITQNFATNRRKGQMPGWTPGTWFNYLLRRRRGLQRIAPMDATCAFRNLLQATRFGGKNPLQQAKNTDFRGLIP